MSKIVSQNCPKCEGDSIASVIYGLPDFDDEKLNKDLDEKTIVLGGCVLWGDEPKLHCNACGYRWG